MIKEIGNETIFKYYVFRNTYFVFQNVHIILICDFYNLNILLYLLVKYEF